MAGATGFGRGGYGGGSGGAFAFGVAAGGLGDGFLGLEDVAGLDGFDQRGAAEEFDVLALWQQVEVLGVLAGLEVHIDLIADDGAGDFGVVLMRVLEFVEVGLGFVGGDGFFFDPADFAFGGLDLDPVVAVVEHLELIAVLDGAGAVRDGGDAVAQVGTLGGHIDIVVGRFALHPVATRS